MQILHEKNVDALYITNANYRRYATGFTSSFGVFVLTKTNAYLFTDARYALAAKTVCKRQNICLQIVKSSDEVYSFLKENAYTTLAVPLEYSSAKEIFALQENGFVICDCSQMLSKSIATKSVQEVQKIQRACKISEQSLLAVLPSIQEGVTELELAGLLEYYMRKFGAENRAFESIVAFAENSAVPHHASSNKILKKGMPVLLDFGAMFDGYAADMTRSFLYAPEQNTFTQFYVHVHKLVYMAHQRAKEAVQVGCLASQIDAASRDFFAQYVVNPKALKALQKKENSIAVKTILHKAKEGRQAKELVNLKEFFSHSLGHGFGVFIHQSPTLSKTSEDILQNNTTFTIEPALYFEGLFGIRIEDSYILKDRAKSFMRTQKNMSILQ